MPDEIDELILVVGYLREQIKDYFGENFSRFKVKYVVQENKLGTYNALKLCEHLLNSGEKFLLMYADDLHGPQALGPVTRYITFSTNDPNNKSVEYTLTGNVVER